MTIQSIQKKGTAKSGRAILVTHDTIRSAARWCDGEIHMAYPGDRPDSEPTLSIVYKKGADEKRVLLNEYLVAFQGEFFAVTQENFPQRFEFTSWRR